jgi:hypothetical protein
MNNRPFAYFWFDSKIIRSYTFIIQVISFTMGKIVPGVVEAMETTNVSITFS